MSVSSGWRGWLPPVTTQSLLGHYLPASGAVSHSLFAIHIFSPSIVSRLFPVGDLAVSNTILFNANLGLGFYVYFRPHVAHKCKPWDRVEFSVLASTMFNFGSLLMAVVVKALLPNKTSTLCKSAVAACLSVFLLTRARKYMQHVDRRAGKSASQRRRSLRGRTDTL